MPITPFLNAERFDLEGTRVLSVAFEMICIGLRTGDCDDGVKRAIATSLSSREHGASVVIIRSTVKVSLNSENAVADLPVVPDLASPDEYMWQDQ